MSALEMYKQFLVAIINFLHIITGIFDDSFKCDCDMAPKLRSEHTDISDGRISPKSILPKCLNKNQSYLPLTPTYTADLKQVVASLPGRRLTMTISTL